MGNDDRDVSDDQSAGFSGRQSTTAALSDIDAAYEELRLRDDAAGPPAPDLGSESAPPFGQGKPLV
jgi:hypothetical protein